MNVSLRCEDKVLRYLARTLLWYTVFLKNLVLSTKINDCKRMYGIILIVFSMHIPVTGYIIQLLFESFTQSILTFIALQHVKARFEYSIPEPN